MIWPSQNPLNCWNPLKVERHNVAGNGKRDGLKSLDMEQWAISSQVSGKPDEGSTTTLSNLLRFGTVNRARARGAFFLARTMSADFPCMVKPNVRLDCHKFEVLNSIIGGIVVDVVNDLIFLKKSSKVSLQDKAVESDVSLGIRKRMIGNALHDVPAVGGDETRMIFIGNDNAVSFGNHANPCGSAIKGFTDFFGRHAKRSHVPDTFNGWGRFLDSLDFKPFHVSQDEFLTDTIPLSDFDGGFEFGVGAGEFFLGDVKFFICHTKDSITLLSRMQEKKSRYSLNFPEMGRSQDKEPDGNNLEIKNQGDTVFIRTVPNITIRDYSKGQDMVIENPDSDKVELNIDKAKYFAFICDDIDKHQSDIGLMDSWSDDAGEQMQITIDAGILGDVYSDADDNNKGSTAGKISGSFDLGTTGASESITKTNVLDYLVDLGTVLDEQNIPNNNRWGVIPAWFSGMIKKSDLKDASLTGDGKSVLRNGRIGMIDRWTLYSSNQVDNTSDSGNTCYNTIFGHKSALSFASQMTKMETLRSEKTFGDVIRGLNVYGYEVLKGEAMAVLYCHKG